MKFNRGFSIFILLFILPSLAFAVLCPAVETEVIKSVDGIEYDYRLVYKQCKACVVYVCRSIEKGGYGCPSDFYDQCSEYSAEIDFIKSKSPNRMGYVNNRMFYLSGCGGARNGTKCLEDLVQSFYKEIEAKLVSGEYKKGEVYWSVGNSSNQNGAFKFIGIIIAIGWILAATWI